VKPDIKFERFLDQFVSGGLVFVGAWYLHRPVLQKYFPIVAGGGVAGATASVDVDILLLLFALGSITLGVLITHSADLAVAACTRPASVVGEERWKRALVAVVRGAVHVWPCARSSRSCNTTLPSITSVRRFR
jgi:hypothetical protein